MNKKHIRQVLTKKHKALVASITDPSVAELVDKNSIITGGALASALLGEPINDFDYYFTNAETTTAVAGYYLNLWKAQHTDSKLNPVLEIKNDGRIKIHIPEGIAAERSDSSDNLEHNPDNESETYASKAPEDAEADKPQYQPVFMSGNAITLTGKVQIIIRFYGDAADIHKNFDFIHCTNYWTSSDKEVHLNLPAMESLMCKQLFYHGSLYPVCSVIRTRKFIKRGWSINAGQYLKMCFQISQLDLTHIPTLEDQLTGVDAAYFRQVIEWCTKKQAEEPEFKLTAPYLISIVDKIFG